MTIHKEITLRYRGSGHLRFTIPATLCFESVAGEVEQALRSIDGVYRVTLYRHKQKLSIRYFETVIGAPDVAREMIRILNELKEEGLLKPGKPPLHLRPALQAERVPVMRRFRQSLSGTWVREKYQEGKETLKALKVLTKRTTGQNGTPGMLQNPERTLMEFANDLLVLYLVKTHWQRIMQEWLPHPLRYRYQWLAIIYLTYLWVRWRQKG